MALNFRTQRVASGVDLIKGITAFDTSGKKFFEKMLGPAEVQRFAQQNPEALKALKMPLFMGFSVNTEKPLGESINTKTGTLTVRGNGGDFHLPNAEKVLTPDELKAQNPLLVINPSICVVDFGLFVSKEFTADRRQFLKFYANQPQTKGWFSAVEGMPGSQASRPFGTNALYRSFRSEFGSLGRSAGYDNISGAGWEVFVGNWRDLSNGVLVEAGALVHDIVTTSKS